MWKNLPGPSMPRQILDDDSRNQDSQIINSDWGYWRLFHTSDTYIILIAISVTYIIAHFVYRSNCDGSGYTIFLEVFWGCFQMNKHLNFWTQSSNLFFPLWISINQSSCLITWSRISIFSCPSRSCSQDFKTQTGI